jgi:hypothetical protein
MRYSMLHEGRMLKRYIEKNKLPPGVKNRLVITCLNCGCQFNPKERGEILRATEANRQGKLSAEQKAKVIAAIIAAIIVLVTIYEIIPIV